MSLCVVSEKLLEELFLLKQIYKSENSYYDREKNSTQYHIPSTIDLSKLSRDPNQVVYLSHDNVIKNLKTLTDAYSIEVAASAFVAGLWSVPTIWQCLLPAKLLANKIPHHQHKDFSSTSKVCEFCGFEQKGVLTTYEFYHRMTIGAPIDGNPIGYVLALEDLKSQKNIPLPTELDYKTFSSIISFIRNLPEKLNYSKVRDMMCKEKLLASNKKYVYQNLLETLAFVGILDTSHYPGMATEFTSYKKREQRPTIRTEAPAPLAWWNSSIGINEDNLKKLFTTPNKYSTNIKQLNIVQSEETLIGILEKKRAPTNKSAKMNNSLDAGKGSIESGDIYAIKVRDGVWVTMYCHEVDGKYATMEFLEGIFNDMPNKEELIKKGQPKYDNLRRKMKVSSMDKTTGVKRIVRGQEISEENSSLLSDSIPSFATATQLRFLAKHYYDTDKL